MRSADAHVCACDDSAFAGLWAAKSQSVRHMTHQAVVSTESKRKLSSLASLGDLSADLLANLADTSRVDHLADVGVDLGVKRKKVVRDGLVVLDLPVEGLELGNETCTEESDWSSVYTSSFLLALGKAEGSKRSGYQKKSNGKKPIAGLANSRVVEGKRNRFLHTWPPLEYVIVLFVLF